MTLKEIGRYLRLHKVKVIVFSLAAIILTSMFVFGSITYFHFTQMDSYLQQTTLARISPYLFMQLVGGIITAFIYVSMFSFFLHGDGFTRLTAKKIKQGEVNVRWSEVVGMESVKSEVWEAIELLKDRARLKMLGGQIIKGVLMVGPPGCGKTYLAKAIATETGLPFLPAVGSDFVGMYVGSGTTTMKNLFKEARILAEIHGGCIIFIDEIDSFARPRSSDSMGNIGAETAHNSTINQFLADMDGLKQTQQNIVVIAATNVSEDKLDSAIMRPGRFDRKIYVGKPGLEDREKLFSFYLKDVQSDPEIDVKVLSRRAVGFSPAEIANMIKEAVLIAAREKRTQIDYKDLSEAYDRVLFGMKSHIVLSEKEKLWTAYHEAGHAIIAYLTHPTDDVIKASIVPRKGYLGYVGHRPQEELHTRTKEWFLANIKCSLGGYAAEKLKMGTTSSGVSSDMNDAMNLSHYMVSQVSMGPSGLLGNHGQYEGSLSEETKHKINEDVQAILNQCLDEVEEILTKEKELLEYFTQNLMKKGELEYDDIVEIFKEHGKERPSEPYI